MPLNPDSSLVEKYDVPAPRYTSYPTVPCWGVAPTYSEWTESIRASLVDPETTWAIYMHLPFCETLCTYCACNTVITKDHSREESYLSTILKEWGLYRECIPEFSRNPLGQFHIGGGTPTFFSGENLKRIIAPIFESAAPCEVSFDGSIEVDPRTTRREQLEVLYELGFRRVSLGVQDFNEEVQIVVNRHQPYEITERVTNAAREIGYTSVNFDLIYGLPNQDLDCIRRTIEQTIQLSPDRIALYSMAFVPWLKPAQKKFPRFHLPEKDEKRALYELSVELLLQAGYIDVGMDHFSKDTDELYLAAQQGRLHRNFMGYTEHRSAVLLGLGVSSIGESGGCFHQSEKKLEDYMSSVTANRLPTMRGHVLSVEDKIYRELVLELMTSWVAVLPAELNNQEFHDALAECYADGLVSYDAGRLVVSELGRPFIRNICLAIDPYLKDKAPGTIGFSRAI